VSAHTPTTTTATPTISHNNTHNNTRTNKQTTTHTHNNNNTHNTPQHKQRKTTLNNTHNDTHTTCTTVHTTTQRHTHSHNNTQQHIQHTQQHTTLHNNTHNITYNSTWAKHRLNMFCDEHEVHNSVYLSKVALMMVIPTSRLIFNILTSTDTRSQTATLLVCRSAPTRVGSFSSSTLTDQYGLERGLPTESHTRTCDVRSPDVSLVVGLWLPTGVGLSKN
jgi:hypothetical protein